MINIKPLKVILINFLVVILACLSEVALSKSNIKDSIISRQKLESDFVELYQRLKQANYDLFANRPEAEFDKHYQEMKQAIRSPMTVSEATIFFQEFVSFANIAHTKIDLPIQDWINFRKGGGKAFPIFIKVIGGKVYVAESYSQVSTVRVGDEIIKFNGEDIHRVISKLRKYKSADTDEMYYGFLEFEFPALLWFEFGAQNSYEITWKNEGGEITSIIPGMTYEQLIVEMEKEKGLLELGLERTFDIEDDIGYLRTGPFFETDSAASNMWDTTIFTEFVDSAFDEFNKNKVEALLIDLRSNPGGDNAFSDYLVQKFADKSFKFSSEFKVKISQEFVASNEKRLQQGGQDEGVSYDYKNMYENLSNGEIFEFSIKEIEPLTKPFNKPVYVLVNRHSYSNAVTTAALIQDYKFGTIIGEETNDLATTYGAMEHFSLSNSQITVAFPKAHIIRPNGERSSQGVTPDIEIKTPLVEFDNDVVLKEAFREIKKNL